MGFAAITTERLLLRPPRPGDAVALAERRSDPLVARWQNWVPPYPLERAEAMLAELSAMDAPVSDTWWMLTITDPEDTEVLGDVAIHPTFDGRSVEIGYTLAPAAWGKGYASEAVAALVDRLWSDDRVTRISAMLHPDNTASERVLERNGFRFEGHTRLSYWVGDDNSDDLLYGLTRRDHVEWTQRPRHRAHDVRVVAVDASNVHTVRGLATHRSQLRAVPPIDELLADAWRPDALPFAIEADGEIVGFALVDNASEPTVVQLFVDRLHQGRGIGTTASTVLTDRRQ